MALICHFFNVPLNQVEELPISQYRKMLDQSINIGNWRSGGKFELLDTDDRQNVLEREYEEYKQFISNNEITENNNAIK